MTQVVLVRLVPRTHASPEIGQVPPRRLDRARLVLHGDVDHAVGDLDLHGAYVLGRVDAQPASFDHRRAPHPDVGVGRGDDHVARPEDGRVAGKAVPGVYADQGYQSAQPGEEAERHAVEPADADAIGVARSLGEEHDRQPERLGQLEQAILLAVVLEPLGTGQHRVVVGHDDGAMTVDRADASDEPVRRRAPDQLVDVAATALGSDDERPVLDEASVVAEVVNVLSRRALPSSAASLDSVRARLVVPEGVPLEDLGQVGPQVIGSPGVLGSLAFPRDRALLENDQGLARHHGVGHGHVDLADEAGGGRLDGMLHLHRLDDDHLLPGAHEIALADIDADDRPVQWRPDGEHQALV